MQKYELGRELHSLDNLVRRYMENYGVKRRLDEITGTNGWIIGYLADHEGEDIYQKDLEKEFTVTRSTASKVINLMEQKGLVKRQSVPHDARLKKLILTDKAMEVAAMMHEDHRKMEECLTNGFSEAEIMQMLSFVKRMKDNIR